MQDLGFSFGISLAFKGLKEIAKSTDSLRAFAQRLDQSTRSVKALNKSIDGLESSKAKISALKEEFGAMSGELMGKAATTFAIVAPVKIAGNVEDDLNRINQYLNADNKTLNNLRKNFLSLSSSIGAPISEVMKLGAEASKLGIKSEAQILAFSKLGISYQKVFELSNEEAAGFMGKLSNIYKLNVEQMQSLGDKIVNVAKVSNVAAGSVAKVMNEVGGDAKLIGMSAEQTAALSAAFASATKDEGEAVGTFKALTGVLSTLNNASDDVKNQFLSLGLVPEQLSAYFKQDAGEAVKVLLNQIKTLPKDSMTDFLNSVFGTGAAGMMQNLVDNTGKYEEALKSLSATKMGGLNSEFNKLNSSTNANLEKLTTSISNLTASLGAALAPAISMIAKTLSVVVNAIRWFVDTFPNLSAAIGTLVVGLIASSVAMTAFKTGMLIARLAMAQFAFSLNAITAAFNILKIAFLTNPIGLILIAIAGIATLVVLNWERVKTWFIGFINWLKPLWQPVANFVKAVFMGWVNAFKYFVNIFKSLSGGAASFFKAVFTPIRNFFVGLFSGIFDWFSKKIEWVSQQIGKLTRLGGKIANFFGFGKEEESQNNTKQEKKKEEKALNSTKGYTKELKTASIPPIKNTQQSVKNSSISVNINGTFNIATQNGIFDLGAFAKEVERAVIDAISKNNDKQKQTTIWG